MSKQVSIRIPKSVEDLFNWCVKYDPTLKGKPAAVVAHFFAKGIQSEYNDSFHRIDREVEAFTSRGIYRTREEVLLAALRLLVEHQMQKEADLLNEESNYTDEFYESQLQTDASAEHN